MAAAAARVILFRRADSVHCGLYVLRLGAMAGVWAIGLVASVEDSPGLRCDVSDGNDAGSDPIRLTFACRDGRADGQ